MAGLMAGQTDMAQLAALTIALKQFTYKHIITL